MLGRGLLALRSLWTSSRIKSLIDFQSLVIDTHTHTHTVNKVKIKNFVPLLGLRSAECL